MSRTSIIKAVITGDASQLDRELGRANSGISKFTKAAGAAFIGIGGAVAIGKPLVDAASDFEEAASKVDQVFGDVASSVDAFSQTSAATLGIASTDALAAASAFGVFGDAAGLTGQPLADFSTDLVRAAADFASFNNVDPDQALEKLRAGLAGEAEPLRAFGVFLDDAALSARAAALGFGDTFSALDSGEKTLVRQAEIMAQLGSTGAMGDFARTSDGLANQQRILSARFKDVQIQLGRKLLPVALKLAEWAIDMIDGVTALIDVFSEHGLAGVIDILAEKWAWFGTARDIVVNVANALAAVWRKVGDDVTRYVTKMFDVVQRKIKAVVTVIDGLIDFVRAVFTGDWRKAWEAVGQIFSGVWDGIVATVQGAWSTVTTAVRAIWSGVKALWDWSFLSEMVGNAIGEVVTFFAKLPGQMYGALLAVARVAKSIGSSIINGIASGISSAMGAVSSAFSGILGAFRSWWNRIDPKVSLNVPSNAVTRFLGLANKGWTSPDLIPDIPAFAKGGVVTGPTVGLIGEAGPEAIIPLSRAGGMGGFGATTVIVELDGQVIAEAVARNGDRAGGVYAA